MVKYRIIEPIVAKIFKEHNHKFKSKLVKKSKLKDEYSIFSTLSQLQVIYIALAEFTPQLITRDENIDKRHSHRIAEEKQRVKSSAIWFSSTDHLNKDNEIIIPQKNDLINSMIQTQNQALDIYIKELKKYCIYFNYTKRQREETISFLRKSMILIVRYKIDIKKELSELNKIIEKIN